LCGREAAIVSKRRDSSYRLGRSPDWIKSKNPACAAREAGGRGGLGPLMQQREFANQKALIEYAEQNSCVSAFMRSGRLNVIVAMSSST
jgi:hypothetical protein